MSALVQRVHELVPMAVPLKYDDGERDVTLWGPPGTGKTTAMLALVNAHLDAGVMPSSLLVATFTRNARGEAFRRIKEETGLIQGDLPWVRTIHSTCFRLLGLGEGQVMGRQDYERFGLAFGYSFSNLAERDPDDPFGGASMRSFGDWCLMAEDIRRARLWSVEQAAKDLRVPSPAGDGWNQRQAQLFADRLEDYKRQTGLLDFADMLERVVAEQIQPPVTHLFIDEAQDLTPAQWQVIDLWARGAVRVFVFGDDDQAIFEWAGADPRALLARPGHQMVLSKSWRLPEAVHGMANRIIGRIKLRAPKRFDPLGPGGEVDYLYTSWLEVGFNRPGTHLVLARNRIHLMKARQELREQGLPFRDRVGNSGIPDPATPRGRAVKTALELGRGVLVLGRADIRNLRQYTSERYWPKGGQDIPRQNIYGLEDLKVLASSEFAERLQRRPLDVLRLPPGEQEYLEQVIRYHGSDALLETPRIEVSTIHGVKGEEADWVSVDTAMTRQTFEEYLVNPDAEHRVAYVAATRARKGLAWLTTAPGYEP